MYNFHVYALLLIVLRQIHIYICGGVLLPLYHRLSAKRLTHFGKFMIFVIFISPGLDSKFKVAGI